MNFIILISLIITLLHLPNITPLPHHFPPRATTNHHAPPHPTTFFQVSHPINHPPTTACTHHILTHDFAYTYAREPVRATYARPSHCSTTKFSTIILEWTATCQGRQFDRIFGVWLGGVELLRGCTAEPTRGGIIWKIEKDVTRYKSLLMMKNINQTLEIYLGNLVDKTYTGIYHVNLTFYYYPYENFVKKEGNFGQANGKNGNFAENYGKDGNFVTNDEVFDQKNEILGQNYDKNGKFLKNDEFLDQKNGDSVKFFDKNGNFVQNDEFVVHNHNKVGNFDQNGEFVDQNNDKNGEFVDNYGEKSGKFVEKGEFEDNVGGSSEMYGNWADKILPISRNLPLKDGLWFEIENSTDVESKGVVIPKNVYRAVLEVYVSFHESDEFWYSNLPNDYILANNLTGNAQGNGPFREVLVSLDGDVVGAVWPFTVVYTGGINPLLWRPITAIGSFDLPSYDVEITPFLGKLLDGKEHTFGFSVTNALNVWYVDANLHLWLDKKSSITKAGIVENRVQQRLVSRSNFEGLNGKFFSGAKRTIASTGWVKSSYGNITTTSVQSFEFVNNMVLGKDGNLQIVNQTIEYNTSVSMNDASPLYMIGSCKTFPLFLYTDEVDTGNNSYAYQSNVTLGFNEKKIVAIGTKLLSTSLKNFQKAEGYMLVTNNLVQGGLGSTHQIYNYDEDNGRDCYFRNVSSYNYTIVSDHESKTCKSDSRNYVARLDDPGILVRE